MRAAGAGPDHQLVFVDRVLVTLVALRWQLSRKVLAVLFGVSGSTVDRAVAEVRPLPAARGFAVPGPPGVRLKTLADVFAYAEAEGITLRIDGPEVQVRRPKANRPGRKAFVSGKKKQIMVEHAIAEPKQWRSLQRWTGDRDDLPEVIAAIGALVSDRSAQRPTRRKPSTELIPARPTAC